MEQNDEARVIAEPEPSPAGNVSVTDWANRRFGQLSEALQGVDVPTGDQTQEEEQTEAPEPEAAQEETQVEEESEAPQGAEETTEADAEDVLSQVDLDNVSEEELNELAERLGSRAIARFGELTRRRKEAEEKLQELQQKLNSQEENPLEPKANVDKNPYSEVKDIEGLKEKAEEVNQVIEWAEDLLFQSDGYGPDDIVTEVEGKELTKRDVRNALRNSRKSKDVYLPAQLKEIQNLQLVETQKQALGKKMTQELPWVENTESDLKAKYDTMMSDPEVKKLEEFSPQLAAYMPYLLAHAVNSIEGQGKTQKKQGVTMTPPKSPNTTGSRPEKGESARSKAVKDVRKRFAESGSKDDFIKLRTLQISR